VVRRALVTALLLWLTADYCDAAAPGVFSFDADQLFVDGAVEPRGSGVIEPTAEAMPVVTVRHDVPGRIEDAARPVARPPRLDRHVARRAAHADARRAPAPVDD